MTRCTCSDSEKARPNASSSTSMPFRGKPMTRGGSESRLAEAPRVVAARAGALIGTFSNPYLRCGDTGRAQCHAYEPARQHERIGGEVEVIDIRLRNLWFPPRRNTSSESGHGCLGCGVGTYFVCTRRPNAQYASAPQRLDAVTALIETSRGGCVISRPFTGTKGDIPGLTLV